MVSKSRTQMPQYRDLVPGETLRPTDEGFFFVEGVSAQGNWIELRHDDAGEQFIGEIYHSEMIPARRKRG